MDTLLTLGSMFFGDTWAEAIWMVMKGTAVLTCAWFILQLRQRLSAANRHLVATFALAGLLILPVLSSAVPPWIMTSVGENSTLIKVATALDPQLLRQDNTQTRSPLPGAGRLEYTPHPAPVPITPPRQESQSTAGVEVVASRDDGEEPTALAVAPVVTDKSDGGGGDLVRKSPVSSPAPWLLKQARVAPLQVRRPPWQDLDPGQFLVVVWGLGLMFLTLKLALGLLRVMVWRRDSEWVVDGPLHDLLEEERHSLNLSWSPRLAVGGVRVPLVGGWLTPVILLPDVVYSWTEERQRLVLRHELAHIHRADHLTVMFHQVILTLHWFNPLVWILVREARRLCEAACDDLVVDRGARPTTYAAHLLAIAADLPRGGSAPALTVADDEPSELERRICALLDPAMSRVASSRKRVVFAGGCTFLVLAWWAGAQLPMLAPPPLVAAELAHSGWSRAGGGTSGSTGGSTRGVGAGGSQGMFFAFGDGEVSSWSSESEASAMNAAGTTVVVPEVRLAAVPSGSAWISVPAVPAIPELPNLPSFPDWPMPVPPIPSVADLAVPPVPSTGPLPPFPPFPLAGMASGWSVGYGDAKVSDMEWDTVDAEEEVSWADWGQSLAQSSLDTLSGWLVADNDRDNKARSKAGQELYDDAFEAYHDDRYGEAAKGFEAAAAAGYATDVSWYNAACSYALMGKGDEAVVALKAAFEAGWSDPMSLFQDNDFDAIRDHAGFREFTHAQFSRMGVDITPYAQALDPRQMQLEAYRQLLKEKSVPAETWYSVGTELLSMRIYPEAQDALKRATQDPSGDVSSARYNLACAYALAGQKAEALDELERAVQAGFSSPQHMLKDSDLASLRSEPRFDDIVKMAKDLSLESWDNQVRGTRFDKKHWAPAVTHFEEYTQAHPTSGVAWYNLGYSLHYSREHLRAVDAFQKAAELGHSIPSAYYNIACAYAMLDQKDAALTWLQKSIDAGGGHYWLMENDKDLDNLRKDARFKALLQSQKAAQKDIPASVHMDKVLQEQLERNLEMHERMRQQVEAQVERQVELKQEMIEQQQEIVERQQELLERQRELEQERRELDRQLQELEQLKTTESR